MIKKISALILFFCLISSSSFAGNEKPLFNKGGDPITDKATDILVKFKPTVKDSRKKEIYKLHHLNPHKRIDQIDVEVLSIDTTQDTAQEVIDRLKAKHKDEIEYAEPDSLLQPDLIPNDPYYTSSSSYHLPTIGAPNAWNSGTGNTVTIAILDSGVYAHPDLAPNLVPGWNFYDNNNDLTDVSGHGTAVAGVAAAAGNNALGGTGVSFTSKIMPLRITDASGMGSSSAIASALTYAADHGAKVANISYGSVSKITTIISAAQYFQSKGGVVTASAGNSGVFDSTADNPYFLLVSATNETDQIESWSNTGNNVDVAAPGQSVFVTISGGGYGSGSGTSFSAPIVAGVAALVYSVNPNLSGPQVQDAIMKSAVDLGAPGWDPQYGWGRVSAEGAVNYALGLQSPAPQPPSAPVLTVITPFSSQASLSWTASADPNYIMGYQVYRDDFLLFSASSTQLKIFDTNLIPCSKYTYSVKTLDNKGYSVLSNAVTVDLSTAPADTTPPSLTATLTATNVTGKSIRLSSWYCSDNVKVAGYKIYRDNAEVAQTTQGAYTDVSLNPGTTYNYFVRCFDSSNNLSVPSTTLTVSTTGLTSDTSSPSIPAGLSATQQSNQVKLSWTASSDNVGVTSYDILRNGEVINQIVTPGYTDILISNAPNTYTVRAFDAAGNISGESNAATPGVVTQIADTTSPTPPTLTGSAPDSSKITLQWSGATDNVGITNYQIFRNSVQIATSTSSSYTDTQVAAGTSYSYTVKAIDAAGNVSAASNVVTLQVPAASLQILNVVVSSKTGTSATISCQTTVPATSRVIYGTTSSNLNLSSSTNALGLNHSLSLTGLNKRTTYYYKVVSTDSSGNTANSAVSSFKTLSK